MARVEAEDAAAAAARRRRQAQSQVEIQAFLGQQQELRRKCARGTGGGRQGVPCSAGQARWVLAPRAALAAGAAVQLRCC